jgi:hypothetical protein
MKDTIRKILKEQKISDLEDTITIDYELWKDSRHGGYHINLRKSQGGYNREGQGRINDYDIKKVVEKGLRDISESIIDGEITHKDRFIVSERSGGLLNVIIEAQNINGVWQLIVITVMRKENFKPNRYTKLQIFV